MKIPTPGAIVSAIALVLAPAHGEPAESGMEWPSQSPQKSPSTWKN